MRRTFVALALGFSMTFLLDWQAQALSTGCASFSGTTANISGLVNGVASNPVSSGDFAVGDVLSLTIPGAGPTFESRLLFNGTVVNSITGMGVLTAQITSGGSTSVTVSYDGGLAGNGVFSCEATLSSQTTQATASAAAQGAVSQTAGLVASRIRSFNVQRNQDGVRRPSTPQLGAIVDQSGLLDLSVGRDGALDQSGESGQSAGYTDSPWGLWANFSWSGINDTTAVAGTQGNVVTGIAGADYQVSDGFIVGGAFSFGGAAFDSQVAAFDTDEVSFGINPYFAYQISDLFSVDGMVGYSFGVGESTRNETITGHYNIHRYYVASNISYFQAWDKFSLLASGGVIWGQSFEMAYTESDLSRVSSRQADIGTAKVLLQPSYLFEVDRSAGLFLEPYVVGEYSYDFTLSKIAGHSNDRDAFRLGLGMNIFSGSSVSGNLEGTTTSGREDQRTVSILGTVRYSF